MLACGGYRSGSTLQYNLAGEYVERINRGRRIGLLDPPEAARLRGLWSIVEALGLAVAKSHHALPVFQDFAGGERTWRELAEEGRLALLYSVRDPRDVVASMARKFALTPLEVLASTQWRENRANLDAWLEMGPLVQRYEQLVGDPQEAVAEIAAHLGVRFDAALARAAAVGAGLEAQRRVTDALEQGTADARFLVHSDHIGTPEGGNWRRFSDHELDAVRREVEPLMERFGYR